MSVATSESPQPSGPPLRLVVLLIAASAPLALGLETLLRRHLLAPIVGPAELAMVRTFLSPTLTAAAWALAPVTVAAGAVGLFALRRTVVRGGSERVLRDRLLLLTSIPQVPAILATLTFMLGARLAPVLVVMALSTVCVLTMGFVGEAQVRRSSIPAPSLER